MNRQDGTIYCSYVPKEALPHTVEVNYGEVAAAHSPYRVYVRRPPDLSKIKIFGNWFETDVKLHMPTNFTVDTRNCGEGELETHVLHDGSKSEIPVKLINNNSVYSVEITPLRSGKYVTNLIFAGYPVPFHKDVFVDSKIDISKAQVQGVKTSEPSMF